MKHVVFIVGSYHPFYSAVGKCIGNIASEFEKKYKVTVICEKNIVGQSDEDVLNMQRIIRVATKMHYNRTDIDERLKSAEGIKKIFWKSRLAFSKFERYLKTALSKSACDRDVISAYMDALNHLNDSVDVIIPTCNQFESVAAALLYKEGNPDIQIIPYLFDLFAESVNINRGRFLLKAHWKANMEYERKMFEESKCIFHVANWTEHIERCFPEYKTKSHEVEHPLLICKAEMHRPPQDDIIHIVYTGVVDAVIRNPKKTLEVLAKLKVSSIKFDFYSFGSAENIVERFSSSNAAIIAHGKVDSDTAECARGRANMLLSIGNVDDSQMPSKLIEYIASGKPIIHFARSKYDPSIQLLKRYPLAKIIDLSSNVDVNKLQAFIQDNAKCTISFDKVKELFQNADPEYIANEIANNFGGGV